MTTTERTTHEIVTRVAEQEGIQRTELPPLAESIDPDALETLVDSGVDYIEFEYCKHRVVIKQAEVTVRTAN